MCKCKCVSNCNEWINYHTKTVAKYHLYIQMWPDIFPHACNQQCNNVAMLIWYKFIASCIVVLLQNTHHTHSGSAIKKPFVSFYEQLSCQLLQVITTIYSYNCNYEKNNRNVQMACDQTDQLGKLWIRLCGILVP